MDVHHYHLYLIFQKWKIKNVTNISGIFGGCKSLSSLPDISKWNTNNIINMSYMLSRCYHYDHYLIFQNGILIRFFYYKWYI